MKITAKHVWFRLLCFIITWEGTGIEKSQIWANNVTVNNSIVVGVNPLELSPNLKNMCAFMYVCVRIYVCLCVYNNLKWKESARTPQSNGI